MNYFPGPCNFTFDVAYQYDLGAPAYCDIKLFPDDPYGANNAHGSPNTSVPPSWTCTHPNSTACRLGGMSEDIINRCELSNGYFNTYTDPPIGVPYWISTTRQNFITYEQGKGLVEPTMQQNGQNPGQGVFPMNRKPVRTYHNGMYARQEANNLPAGWYILMRFHPKYGGSARYATPLFRYLYSTTLFPGSGGACSTDGRQNVNYFSTVNGSNSSPYWTYGGISSCLSPANWNLNGYTDRYYRWNFACWSSFIQDTSTPNRGTLRRIYDLPCGGPCR